MIRWLRRILSRITGISTPLGGISWRPSETTIPKVSTSHKPIYVTYPENHEIISFLEANDRKIVFLDTYIDASVSIREQVDIVEKEGIDLDLLTSGSFSGMPLPLPNKEGNLITVTFYFTDDHILKSVIFHEHSPV
ncbi:MAG: hypothetical protein M0Z71_00040 [Nitrospiraceae bacterium]|nr:hypothetical protein [Nitrospiraceae bacterium]